MANIEKKSEAGAGFFHVVVWRKYAGVVQNHRGKGRGGLWLWAGCRIDHGKVRTAELTTSQRLLQKN